MLEMLRLGCCKIKKVKDLNEKMFKRERLKGLRDIKWFVS